MEAIIIHPRNKEQLNALKVIFKEMKIPFEKAKKEKNLSAAEDLSQASPSAAEDLSQASPSAAEDLSQASPYDPEFVKEILQAKQDIEKGLGKAIKTEDLWK